MLPSFVDVLTMNPNLSHRSMKTVFRPAWLCKYMHVFCFVPCNCSVCFSSAVRIQFLLLIQLQIALLSLPLTSAAFVSFPDDGHVSGFDHVIMSRLKVSLYSPYRNMSSWCITAGWADGSPAPPPHAPTHYVTAWCPPLSNVCRRGKAADCWCRHLTCTRRCSVLWHGSSPAVHSRHRNFKVMQISPQEETCVSGVHVQRETCY